MRRDWRAVRTGVSNTFLRHRVEGKALLSVLSVSDTITVWVRLRAPWIKAVTAQTGVVGWTGR